MQEEVENRTVNLAISTTKLTFRTIVNGYNAWKRHHQAKVAQKTSQLPVGKQSIKELIGQNQGVSSIPIEKTDLKGFEQVARKYGVDYAITKDQNVMPPKYTVFFKAKDADTQNSSRILTQLILIGILLHWRKLMQIQNDCLCRMREKKLKKIQL